MRDLVEREEPIFAKPVPGDLKLFPGMVLTRFRDLVLTASLPSSHAVVCSDPVEMVSEYRVFVARGEVVGCRHYKGDFRRFPDFGVIDATIQSFHEAPRGYGIDFAVTAGGETVLVEVNDGFSLGCYGLPALPYSLLLESRWEELVAGAPAGGQRAST